MKWKTHQYNRSKEEKTKINTGKREFRKGERKKTNYTERGKNKCRRGKKVRERKEHENKLHRNREEQKKNRSRKESAEEKDRGKKLQRNGGNCDARK